MRTEGCQLPDAARDKVDGYSNPAQEGLVDRAWHVLEAVSDPEIPVISVVDLGIVRAIERLPDGGGLRVTVTPTYSGCPAMEVISRDIRSALEAAELGPVALVTQRAPAWTTDWISAAGREKLRAYGIAPPSPVLGCPVSSILASLPASIPCPRCGSENTQRLAQFGSTPCKALYRCNDCAEPFDYFKPI
jgi:ring-1,2-phenylacetyl-CoA epoxidase subunit PaaD